MPLSPPAERQIAHTRRIALFGYRRADGQYDIEAQLTDTKPYRFANVDRGVIEAGEPLHGMAMRMTVNDAMVITGFEARTDYSPYGICPSVAANFTRLVGLRIARGFLREAAQRVGGTEGCTHLRELLQQMATVAFQTTYPARAKPDQPVAAGRPPALLNTCHAYAADSPVVQRQWPEHYTGAGATE